MFLDPNTTKTNTNKRVNNWFNSDNEAVASGYSVVVKQRQKENIEIHWRKMFHTHKIAGTYYHLV